MGPEMLQKAFLQQLESYFGKKVETEFRQFLMKNWTDEVHLRGGPVNYTSPGQMHNFHELRKKSSESFLNTGCSMQLFLFCKSINLVSFGV